MLEFLFGEWQYGVRFLFALIVVLGVIGLTAWLVRRLGATHPGAATTRGRQPRLAVIDAAAVDARRRLVLIRRDNVEHLLLIGGPTDMVIEPNIVRAAAARDLAPPRQLPAADTLPRPVPLGETGTWPLQPEPAPAPQAAARRMAPPPQPMEEPQASWPAEPELPQLPRQSRPLDPLSGLAAELSRSPSPEPVPPASPPPRPVRPREVAREPTREPPREVAGEAPRELARELPRERAQPQPPYVSSADHNLAEMAQRLEAALRRPGAKAEARAEPRPRPVPEPMPEAEPAPPEPAPEARREVMRGPSETRREARREVKPAQQRSLYDSLEQEMASLLGRPNSKA